MKKTIIVTKKKKPTLIVTPKQKTTIIIKKKPASPRRYPIRKTA